MNYRTDLALEEVASSKTIKNKPIYKNNCKITKVNIDSSMSKKYKKNPGIYVTIETDSIRNNNHDNMQEVIPLIRDEIKKITKKLEVTNTDPILVVGLGNKEITPDSLGPNVISDIIVTNHLIDKPDFNKKFGHVAALAPGVMGQTGMETLDIIKGVIKCYKPKLVIVIDALAARSIDRINSSIQITTSGINPGSGVGNMRKELSKATLGVDVIAIGVPTVVDIESVFYDMLEDSESKMKLKYANLNLFVTPKEIDVEIVNMSYLISRAINLSLHNLA